MGKDNIVEVPAACRAEWDELVHLVASVVDSFGGICRMHSVTTDETVRAAREKLPRFWGSEKSLGMKKMLTTESDYFTLLNKGQIIATALAYEKELVDLDGQITTEGWHFVREQTASESAREKLKKKDEPTKDESTVACESLTQPDGETTKKPKRRRTRKRKSAAAESTEVAETSPQPESQLSAAPQPQCAASPSPQKAVAPKRAAEREAPPCAKKSKWEEPRPRSASECVAATKLYEATLFASDADFEKLIRDIFRSGMVSARAKLCGAETNSSGKETLNVAKPDLEAASMSYVRQKLDRAKNMNTKKYSGAMTTEGSKAYHLAKPDLEVTILNLIELANSYKQVKKGTKEVTKTVKRGSAEVLILAADTNPKILRDLPLVCEAKNVAYVFVGSTNALARACGLTTRKVVACSIISIEGSQINSQIQDLKDAVKQM